MLVFDLESNGLLNQLDTIHCINIKDTKTGVALRFNDQHQESWDNVRHGSIRDALKLLQEADDIGGHNVVNFDVPAIQKVYPCFCPKGAVIDTLLLSRLLWPDLKERDFINLKAGKLPKRFSERGLIGSHKLEAWGYRLGILKGDISDEDGTTDWSVFTKEMDDYCSQDSEITEALYNLINTKAVTPEMLRLETRTAEIIGEQERTGVKFDIEAAIRLQRELELRRAELNDTLQSLFPPWRVFIKTFIPKRPNGKLGYTGTYEINEDGKKVFRGDPVDKYENRVFKPSSRMHIADRLSKLYGWEPKHFTNGGQPKVDEDILKGLEYKGVKELIEYMMIDKRLGQISSGRQAWIQAVKKDGRIHGRVNTNGAVTGRMTHSSPNLAQVPSGSAPYGPECRALFIVEEGNLLVGCDAEGLELRCLAHYMAKYDGGAYGKAVVDGKKEDGSDVHSVTQNIVGLNARDSAKTFIYAMLYGAGDVKLGTVIRDDMSETERLQFSSRLSNSRNESKALLTLGAKARSKLMRGLPALQKLIKGVSSAAEAKGYLTGLDGRQLHVRSPHAALNTLLQSAGALVMKEALIRAYDSLKEAYPEAGIMFVLNIHDEFQIECPAELAEDVGKIAAQAIHEAGVHFNFRCELAGSYDVGPSWRETH